MTFQSYEYLGLLASAVVVYWLLPRSLQNVLLLAASYVFYAYVDQWLAIVLLGYTTVNYSAALGMRALPDHRRKMLLVAVAAGVAVLGTFKYFGFFVENISGLLSAVGLSGDQTVIRLFLPAGISFYTFQTLAYVIDVYKGRVEPRSSFIDVALFISFFPQLVAGPIERASRLLPQFEIRRRFDPDSAREGLYLIIWGFFKKLVIADNVAVIVNKVFQLQEPSPALLAVGVLAFGIQILADFSGYTDIARGSARLLGINLTQNFNNPYLSSSPTDFWRRWHMSLSSWFRDYVYFPLGGSRMGKWRNSVTLMATFLLAGLWHGAAWNFVLWGGYHGALILAHRLLRGRLPRGGATATALAVFATFVLVQVGWLMFRADDLGIVWDSLTAYLDGDAVGGAEVTAFLFFQVFVYSLPLWAHAVYQRVRSSRRITEGAAAGVAGAPFKAAAATFLFLGILVLRSQGTMDFIYFQF